MLSIVNVKSLAFTEVANGAVVIIDLKGKSTPTLARAQPSPEP